MTVTMPHAVRQILDWQQAHQGQVAYSETAGTRLAYDTAELLTPTDCSGMVARMFGHFANVHPGTYTGNECDYGRQLSTSHSAIRAGDGLLPGDVVLFCWDGWNPAWDHIAIYAGNGQIWNHGGPGDGPNLWSLAGSVDAATNVMARRFIPWTTPTPPNLLEEIMALDRSSADYKNLVSDVAQAVWDHKLTFQPGTKNSLTAKASIWLTYGNRYALGGLSRLARSFKKAAGK